MITNKCFKKANDNEQLTLQAKAELQGQSDISDLFSGVANSNLADSQKKFLGLKLYEILNEELNTAENVIGNYHKLGKTPEKAVKEYHKEIKKIQNIFSEYYAGVFEQMYEDEKISPLQKDDLVEHYQKRISLEKLQSDRSTLQKKLKHELRGFSGSVRGAGKSIY